MEFEYIVVQAGGKGTRLQHLTTNKPKAIVPVNNLPIIFHLFKEFPDKKFIIIGDYKADVLKKYLDAFAKVKFVMVNANGDTGTCAGISKAISFIPINTSFMLIWSDLILSQEFEVPKECEDYIGLSKDFPCRWRYENDIFEEIPSENTGVAGCFVFKDKEKLKDVPQSGELVRWLQSMKYTFKTIGLAKTKEYGLLKTIDKVEAGRCRPFNKIEIKGNHLVKVGIDEQGIQLAQREQEWYRAIQNYGYTKIPQIYSFEPFEMELIKGKNIYQYELDFDQKKTILFKMINNLKELHKLGSCATDIHSVYNAYLGKTYERLSKIRDLIPFGNQKIIKINGKDCHNIYFYRDEVDKLFENYIPKEFVILHGDCTFSNMLLKDDKEPVFIDPRGYFGYTKMYGDVAYDWAKLYYSIVGNYDRFNLKDFRLTIGDNEVELKIESNKWEDMEDIFLDAIKDESDSRTIKLLHAIIWLSLTTYAWEDYDSICGAFYNGLYYLEDVL